MGRGKNVFFAKNDDTRNRSRVSWTTDLQLKRTSVRDDGTIERVPSSSCLCLRKTIEYFVVERSALFCFSVKAFHTRPVAPRRAAIW